MKKIIDLTKICSYDGMCMLSEKNQNKYQHGWCYGERFGCEECPLKSPYALIHIKSRRKYENYD